MSNSADAKEGEKVNLPMLKNQESEMSKLKRIALALAIAVPSLPTFADNVFEGAIPIRFAEGLLNGRDFGQPTFYSDILDSFPEIDFPSDFEVLGSADLGVFQRVILRTDLGIVEARESLSSALLATDFIVIPSMGADQPEVGFILPITSVKVLSFCHNSIGGVLVRFRKAVNDSIVTLDHNPSGPSPTLSCLEHFDEMLLQAENYELRKNAGLQSYQPKLVFPEPSKVPLMSSGNGTYSSGGDGCYQSSTMALTEWPIEDLYQHFSDQIETQGWVPASTNVTKTQAEGSWNNPADSDFSLRGTLSLKYIEGAKYSVIFMLKDLSDTGTPSPNTPTLVSGC